MTKSIVRSTNVLELVEELWPKKRTQKTKSNRELVIRSNQRPVIVGLVNLLMMVEMKMEADVRKQRAKPNS